MKNLNRIFGIILILPALISVPLFIINLTVANIDTLANLGTHWTGGAWSTGDSGSGFTSSVPFYFGLMAIGGSILLKESK